MNAFYSDFKYEVVTEVSSQENPRRNWLGLEILFETNNFQKARKECIEWAAYDDIPVRVVRRVGAGGHVKFKCDGYHEAISRYPKTAMNF